jgi:transposase InsO family protein
MPWKETRKMDQRMEFAMKSVDCPNFGQLCREYGISRKTGYKWRERFVSRGLEGMEEKSRRPHGHSQELSEKEVCRIVDLKNGHKKWGPRKIRELYARKYRGELPSESSFKRVLERAGLTRKRTRRKQGESGRLTAEVEVNEPNALWTVDFKGWWHGRDGKRVEPLTVRDGFSRYLLEMRVMENARTENVGKCFEQLFENHGLPLAIRSDNGVPFASARGLLGLTRLSAWWLVLGIELIRGRPGCPQDNGAHERIHRDIADELEKDRIGRDQDAFDLWRHEFNNERPHESIGMKTPSEIYVPSPRLYAGTPEQIDYQGMDTRRVKRMAGTIQYRGETIQISSTLGGWDVGLRPRDDGYVEIWFARLLLGHINPKNSSFMPVTPDATNKQCHPPSSRFWSSALRSEDQKKH